ncbi:hypothetical protein [Leptolyngbya sp. 7M]|uniref:hypothetical protein n=1 Tax=Leptolyngbya sp. 7M TaxID=2812896 RepID=UPI001B8CE60B|nr:hypothetical protein [Leptolyngbya sp. 7M]QYO65520.1 hypothetical protein JVX88_01665 [Leptolyngbya sp. 7M]
MRIELKHTAIVVFGLFVAALFAVSSLRSYFLIQRLERRVDEAQRLADENHRRAAELEIQTHIFKEKAAYLESELAEIQTAARKQDETLEKLSADTDAARRDLQRLRGRTR